MHRIPRPSAAQPRTFLYHICKLPSDLGLVAQVVMQAGAPELGWLLLPLLPHPIYKLQSRGAQGEHAGGHGRGAVR